ncbi:hypothetical protein Tco_0502129 [Tanacetum coccineum]
MSTPTFAATHNLVAFLEKPAKSIGFEQIIDFLNAKPFKYALTVNPTVHTSCIKQFWATTKVKKVNVQDQIQALVDKQMQEWVLKLLLGMNSTALWHLPLSVLPTTKIFLNKQVEGMSKHKETFVISSHTKKVFANMRRQSDGFSRSVTPLFDTMMVKASEEVGEDSDHLTDSNQIPFDTQPSTSKPQKKQKPRRNQRQSTEVPSPTNEIPVEESVPTPSNDPLPSGEDSFQLNELMVFYTSLQKQVLDLQKAKTAQAKEIATLKKRVNKLERKRRSRPTGLKRLRKGRNIAEIDQDENVTLLDETQGNLNDEEMFGVNDLHGEEVTIKDTATEVIVKDIAAFTIPVTTAELARQLDAEMQVEIKEEERIRRQKEKEANIALIELWENKQAMMEADRLLAERLQTGEREELTIEEKSKLFVELMNKRRKHFAKLSTKAQKRTQMSTYLKHMGNFKHSQLKSKTYEDIERLFEIEMKRVNSFIPMDADDRTDKEQERSPKRVGDDLESDVSKKQRVDEQ